MSTTEGLPGPNRTAIAAMIGLGLLIAVGLGAAILLRPTVPPPPRLVGSDPLLARGYGFYRANCVTCHGPDGRGAKGLAEGVRPSDLTGRWKHGDRPEHVLQVLRDGVPGTPMPGWAGFPEADRRAVAAYLYSLAGREVPGALRGAQP